MNCAVEKDKELLNVQVPKASTNKEAEEYQPVTPFDLRIDTDFKHQTKGGGQIGGRKTATMDIM